MTRCRDVLLAGPGAKAPLVSVDDLLPSDWSFLECLVVHTRREGSWATVLSPSTCWCTINLSRVLVDASAEFPLRGSSAQRASTSILAPCRGEQPSQCRPPADSYWTPVSGGRARNIRWVAAVVRRWLDVPSSVYNAPVVLPLPPLKDQPCAWRVDACGQTPSGGIGKVLPPSE